MTRVVVIGPYPPTADPLGDTVLATVRRLRAEGATVTVVSPEPSAAPVHGDPTRRPGAARVARALRDADRVVWFAPPGAVAAAPVRRALAAVPDVQVQPLASRVAPPAGGLTARARRVRAGAPTALRTARRRWTAWLRPGFRSRPLRP